MFKLQVRTGKNPDTWKDMSRDGFYECESDAYAAARVLHIRTGDTHRVVPVNEPESA